MNCKSKLRSITIKLIEGNPLENEVIEPNMRRERLECQTLESL